MVTMNMFITSHVHSKVTHFFIPQILKFYNKLIMVKTNQNCSSVRLNCCNCVSLKSGMHILEDDIFLTVGN